MSRRGKPALRSGLATSELLYSARAHVGARWQHAKILDSELSIAKANEVFMLANFEEEKADQWGDWVPNRHRRPARRRAVARGQPGAMPQWAGQAARRRAVTLPAGARLPQDWDMTEKEFLEALVRLCSAREAAWADVADLAAKFELFLHDVLELLIAGRCRRVRALSRPPRMLSDRLRVEAPRIGLGSACRLIAKVTLPPRPATPREARRQSSPHLEARRSSLPSYHSK